MCKQHYVVNCYNCQHNGQETCKGCRTLLVGEDEPYENWQLREDLETKDQRIAELEEQLKSAIRFKTPYVERFAVVQYVHRQGKPYKIEHCYDCYKDENMNTVYCYYNCDSYNFHVIQICDTKEEALTKLEELKGERNANKN